MNPKQIAGEKATEYIRTGMIVGLGTGSTAYWAIRKIGALVQEGLEIKALATSLQSEALAREAQIPLISFAQTDHIDCTIDGADEVDTRLNLIKGGGGALLREKIVASASRQLIIVADEKKLVPQLGHYPLPVEIIPFGHEITLLQLQKLGCNPVLRKKDGELFISDNGNYIADCPFGQIPEPAVLQEQINLIPGVVDNGLFVNRASAVVVGYADGTVKVMEK